MKTALHSQTHICVSLTFVLHLVTNTSLKILDSKHIYCYHFHKFKLGSKCSRQSGCG